MKKSKLIFFAVAAVVLVICLVLTLMPTADEPDPTAPPGTELTLPIETGPPDETQPIFPTSSLERPSGEIQLADNVRIVQVEKDPNEVIRAFEPIGPDDYEYLPDGSDTYTTAEGKVFRNDKTISIDIFDEYTGKTMTFTFGCITGELNRFLYLNPVYEQGEEDPYQYGFHFIPMLSGGGSIATLPLEYTEVDLKAAHREADSFHVGRTLDQCQISDYVDPIHPGTVWFTQTPLSGHLWLDVICYQMGGDMLATLRLTIAKDPDGTYSIVNLENKNLLQLCEEEDASYNKDELAHIYSLAMNVLGDPDQIKMATTTPVSEITIERCIIEERDPITGMYHPYFAPLQTVTGKDYASASDYLDTPLIAVSARRYGGYATAVTMYFRVLKPASAGTHGTYEYIGRDFLFYTSANALKNQGYPSF